MQEDLSRHIARVFERLNSYFRLDPLRGSEDLLKLLIRTVLSQNTSDRNSSRAAEKLFSSFKSTEALINAPIDRIELLIGSSGLAKQKAATICRVLDFSMQNNGGKSLRFLCELPVDDALERLTSIKGVGIKTASIVLAFGCGKDLCPVDTHVNRIAGRIGWVKPGTPPNITFQKMRTIIPDGKAIRLHRLLIRHGREICHARAPVCEKCPVNYLCTYYGKHGN